MHWFYFLPLWFFIWLLAIHSFWFIKKKKKFMSQALRLIKDNMRKRKYSSQTEVDTDVIRYVITTLWSFNKMYFHFWIWNFKKMTDNSKAFEEVEKFGERSENKVLPFKKKVTANHKLRKSDESSCQQ